MATKKKKVDGRTRRSKGTTERETIDMGGRALTLFRYTEKSQSQSPYWNARTRILKNKVVQISTKEEDIKRARKVAKEWWASLVARVEKNLPVERDPRLFHECALSWFRQAKMQSGVNKHRNYYKDHKNKYDNYIYPFFKNIYIEQIDTVVLRRWMDWRTEHGMVHSNHVVDGSQLKRELSTIRLVLRDALEHGVIKSIPVYPRLPIQLRSSQDNDNERAYFNSKEYAQLLRVSRSRLTDAEKHVNNSKGSQGGGWTKILRDRLLLHYYIIILASTGMRPEECLRLTHRQITAVKKRKDEDCYLDIAVKGKRGERQIFSKYGGYFAYMRLRKELCKNASPHDLVFTHNPYSGLKTLLEDSDLRFDRFGHRRDSKSLRHYYICKELVDEGSVFRVSVQCGVDPSVIKRHYGRHITSAHYKDVLIKTSPKELL